MLNTFVRTAVSCIIRSKCNQIRGIQRVQTYASFTQREILNERSDETGTLLNRFAKYIAMENMRTMPAVPTTIRYSDYFPVTTINFFETQLRRTSSEQLPALITFAFTYRTSAEPNKFASVLNDLDAAAMRQLDNMDEDTILRTLYAFLFLMPNWMSRLDFYHAAVRQLVAQNVRSDKPTTKDKFMQLCFYLGLGKKQKVSSLLQQFLQHQLEHHLPALNGMDLALVASSAFKTSTQVHSDAYNDKLQSEILKMTPAEIDDAMLITLIKSMRFQRVRSEAVCEHLENFYSSKELLIDLQPRGLVHIFAYFAENLWDRLRCMDELVAAFMQRLNNVHRPQVYSESLRGKDIAMFLWCCAQLNCTTFSALDVQRIEAVLLEKSYNGEFNHFPDQLVDCCLSLWILQHRSQKLLQEAMTLKLESNPKQIQPKVDSRLGVLLTAAAIEEPTWRMQGKPKRPFNADEEAPNYLIKDRKDLVQLAEGLSQQEGVSAVSFCCPVNEINIPGLLVHFEEAPDTPVFVDLLTKEQTLRFSKQPVGILRLKIRLLNALNHKHILLNQSDLTEGYNNLKDAIFEVTQSTGNEEQSVHNI